MKSTFPASTPTPTDILLPDVLIKPVSIQVVNSMPKREESFMVEMRRVGTAEIANPKITDQIRRCKKSGWSEISIGRDREVQRKAKKNGTADNRGLDLDSAPHDQK